MFEFRVVKTRDTSREPRVGGSNPSLFSNRERVAQVVEQRPKTLLSLVPPDNLTITKHDAHLGAIEE